MGFQSCRLPARKRSKPLQNSKHLPQQAPQGQGHFPNRHPRAKATAIAFYRLSKLPFASPQTLQTFQNFPNPPNPPNTVPSRHPRAKATSRTGTPGPRPQQWLSMGFQRCRLPARKRSKPSKTLQTLQTLQNPPNPPNTLQNLPGPRPLPQQAPQGQGHSNGFLWAFKAAVCPPANAPNLPNTLQNPPNPPNTLPSRHPRAKATSPTGTPGPRPQHSFLWAFKAAVCQPANAPNPPKPSKPSKHPPQQAPQGQGHFPNRHPRAKATA